jgi:hypothetical protein
MILLLTGALILPGQATIAPAAEADEPIAAYELDIDRLDTSSFEPTPLAAGDGSKKERKQDKKEAKLEKKQAKWAELPPYEDRKTWRFSFDNDVVFGSDNQFTNGWVIQKHGSIGETWEEGRGTLAVGKPIARWFLPDKKEDRFYREGFGIGQVMQTPDELEIETFQQDDVPYAGILFSEHNWIAYNDKKFAGFQILFGIMGEGSLAEETQKGVHELIDSTEPEGWDNQLDDEPILNLTWMRKHKIWNTGSDEGVSFEGSVSMDLVVGNFWTGADVALEMRLGRNMPRGFHFIPSPSGRQMSYDATLPPAKRDLAVKSVFYFSLALRGSAIAFAAPIEGNLFSDEPDVILEPEDFVGAVIGGLHYQRRQWGVHVSWTVGSDTVDEDESPLIGDADSQTAFGTIMIERRF